MAYKDFGLMKGEYGQAQEYYDNDALTLAIRNILLSKPGNFPMHPSIGMNIKKYMFELLDDNTVASIQSELNRSIAENIPELKNITATVRRITADNGQTYLCFAIYNSRTDDEAAMFVINNNGDLVNVFNAER